MNKKADIFNAQQNSVHEFVHINVEVADWGERVPVTQEIAKSWKYWWQGRDLLRNHQAVLRKSKQWY